MNVTIEELEAKAREWVEVLRLEAPKAEAAGPADDDLSHFVTLSPTGALAIAAILEALSSPWPLPELAPTEIEETTPVANKLILRSALAEYEADPVNLDKLLAAVHLVAGLPSDAGSNGN